MKRYAEKCYDYQIILGDANQRKQKQQHIQMTNGKAEAQRSTIQIIMNRIVLYCQGEPKQLEQTVQIRNIRESLVVEKMQKNKSINNEKDVQQEVLTKRISCFSQKILLKFQFDILRRFKKLKFSILQNYHIYQNLTFFQECKFKQMNSTRPIHYGVSFRFIYIIIIEQYYKTKELETKEDSITKWEETYNDQMIQAKQKNKRKNVFIFPKKAFTHTGCY
ncbi:unnamed protein product [Paramecium octaurelia]|uniref:Uncharacterized protein n=1 Tax=Paramecium octaurelia TaxID=43137 RepID=A0A8S1RZQ1_PAROT|nr:unnamed protein product [Paramecium octaurelia]